MTPFFTTNALGDLSKSMIGFENLFANIASAQNQIAAQASKYPPYNIRKTGDNTFCIELAVAGFARQDIDVELDGDKLVIKGKTAEQPAGEYLFQGLANRSFVKHFTLDDRIVIQNAALVNGVLKIAMERIVAEQSTAKKIKIDEPTSSYQYLTEDSIL